MSEDKKTIPRLSIVRRTWKRQKVMEFWSGGVRGWSIGVLEYWSGGVVELEVGVLEYWSIGVVEVRGGR